VLSGVGSDARSRPTSDPGSRTATHCVDELIGARVGSRLEPIGGQIVSRFTLLSSLECDVTELLRASVHFLLPWRRWFRVCQSV